MIRETKIESEKGREREGERDRQRETERGRETEREREGGREESVSELRERDCEYERWMLPSGRSWRRGRREMIILNRALPQMKSFYLLSTSSFPPPLHSSTIL
jgi:hypothetical protein